MSVSDIEHDASRFTRLVPDMLNEIRSTRRALELSPDSERIEPSGLWCGELSERELEVLGYLPTMLTASEIGAELLVSVNTIKAHMRSIYGKIGASRRRDAVVRAYQHGIL
jgi:ATP/maltotriose-dependent transcriptional regulator MalT